MKKIWLLWGYLLCTISSFGQNAGDDFKKITATYENKVVSIDLLYQVYKNVKSPSPIQTENGKMVKNGNKSYLKMGSIEMIQNPNYNLMVDHESKMIALLQVEKKFGNVDQLKSVDLNAALANCDKIDFVKEDKQYCYVLNMKASNEYKMIKVFFNPKTYYLEKLDLFYRNPIDLDELGEGKPEAPRLVITYKKTEINVQMDASLFTYSNFLKKDKDSYSCLEKYKNYELINQLGNK